MINWIKKDHASFMTFADPHTMRVNTVLRKAEVDGLIIFDTVTNAWTWKASGDVIKQFPREADFDRYASYMDWMKESDEANALLDDLEKGTGLSKETATVTKKASAKATTSVKKPAPSAPKAKTKA